MVTRIAPAALFAALSACGGLETPDLSRGAVSGSIAGASPGAYAYVYGAPQLRADLAPDGSFEIDQVPVGSADVILFDGASHAELVAVQVQGATRAWIYRTSSAMPVAGHIIAAVAPQGGTTGVGATYSVDGTILSGVQAAGALSVDLWPLPPSQPVVPQLVVRGALPGFLGGATAVTVVEGNTATAEIDLFIDGSASPPGCAANQCHASLVCEASDGWCYQCASNPDCTVAGETCVAHTCVAASGRVICEPCNVSTDCGSNLCLMATGGSYCSQPCTQSSDCPAGLACMDTTQGKACVALLGCGELTAAFGAPCVDDTACTSALASGSCVGLSPTAEVGYCSAPCLTAADCSAALGLPSCTAGHCAP